MITPRRLYMDDRGGTSLPLRALMKLMELEPADDFATAIWRIAEARWSRLPVEANPEQKKELQAHLPEFRPYLEELGVLRPFPDKDSRLQAGEMVWPGASARQARERLLPGVRAVIEGRLPNIGKITALAAQKRKPVGNEIEYLADIVLNPQQCLEKGYVLEGEIMRHVWERTKVDYNGLLKYLRFAVITTDMVPPEALHGRPTNLSTLAAWWHLNPNPRRVAITSIAPYGYRFWCEASHHFRDCSWELIAPVPDEPSVVGAISEVGKIVYNLA